MAELSSCHFFKKSNMSAGNYACEKAGLNNPTSFASNIDSPMRNSSTFRAASRPSEIAHTTKDCPRRQSPAANTFSTEVL